MFALLSRSCRPACVMMTMRPRPSRRGASRWCLAPTLLVLAACGGGDDGARRAPVTARPLVESTTTGVADGVARPPSGAIVAGRAPCPMTGIWHSCSVIERLTRAGLGTEAIADSVRQPGLTIAGTAYRMGDGELQLFLYADSADARREAATVRRDDAEPAAVGGILRPPAVIHSLNLVALFFNNNDRQLERVELAITAGLPAR